MSNRICASCGGSGECSRCDGTGKKVGLIPPIDYKCARCDGTGTCPACGGSGKV